MSGTSRRISSNRASAFGGSSAFKGPLQSDADLEKYMVMLSQKGPEQVVKSLMTAKSMSQRDAHHALAQIDELNKAYIQESLAAGTGRGGSRMY